MFKLRPLDSSIASHNNVSFGTGQQQYTQPNTEDKNIFAANNQNVNHVTGVGTESYAGITIPKHHDGGNVGLVEKFDKMDAMILKPNYQDEYRENVLKGLYA